MQRSIPKGNARIVEVGMYIKYHTWNSYLAPAEGRFRPTEDVNKERTYAAVPGVGLLTVGNKAKRRVFVILP